MRKKCEKSQNGFINAKASLVTASVLLAAATVSVPLSMNLNDTGSPSSNSSTGTGICVVAEFVDDSKDSSMRGDCSIDDDSNVEEPIIPEETPPPIETAPPSPEETEPPIVIPPTPPKDEVFNEKTFTVVSMDQISPLNNGGTIASNNEGVFLTKERGGETRKLSGLDSKMTGLLKAEASPDGGTIVVFNTQWAQVSWDEGETWSEPRTGKYFSLGRIYRLAAVSEDGNTVSMINGTPTADNHISIFKNGENLWRDTQVYFTKQIHLSSDGSEIISADIAANNGLKRFKTDQSLSMSQIKVLGSSGRFGGFSTSGDQKDQVVNISKSGSPSYNVLSISHDSGQTWSDSLRGSYLSHEMSSDGNTIVAMNSTNIDQERFIHISKDAGLTWSVVDLPHGIAVSNLELSKDGKTMITRGLDGNTYLSSVARD